MVKVIAKEFKKKIKKNPYLPILLVVIVLILGIALKLSYDVFIEKESITADFLGSDQDYQFSKFTNSNLQTTDPLVIQRIDSDLRPILEKYLGKVKLDRSFLIKSVERDNWHYFYFTNKAPRLEVYENKIIPEFESLGYTKMEYENARTYDYTLDFQGNKYLVIVNLLSYNSDDSIGIFMIYVGKL